MTRRTVVALLLVTFTRSPFGLSLRGVRSNEARLAALGYRTGLHRYLAWVITVFFTGVAGVYPGAAAPDTAAVERGRAARARRRLGPSSLDVFVDGARDPLGYD